MSKNKVYAIIAVILVIIFSGALIWGIGYNNKDGNVKNTKKNTETAKPTDDDYEYKSYEYLDFGKNMYRYTDNIDTYLFIGTDGSGNEDATDESYRGTMADFLLLFIVNHTTEKYGFIQIDRDTICDVTTIDSSGEGEGMDELQICTAHWYGKDKEQSADNTVEAVSMLFGEFNIEGYYCINMEDIGTLNDIVGGVEVTIEDDFSKEDESLVMGKTILLSDEQAENFIRGRMSVGDGENTSRMRRQRQYMSAYMDKARQLFENDLSFVNNAFDRMKEVALTDINGNQVSKISNALYNYDSCGIFTIEGESKKGEKLGDGLLHSEFYASKESIISDLQEIINLNIDE